MSEWIKWNGGACPVHPNTRVDVRYRDLAREDGLAGASLVWAHVCGDVDIVSYRLSGDQQSANALGTQIEGTHYLGFKVQPVEFINANDLDFLQGSIIKYISRHKLKGKQADVEKAIHFCKLILELQYESASS